MTGAALVRGNAVAIPLRDESVDLVVTSPPYFALRSYRDDGEHYGGQIGSEPTAQAFLEALWSVTAELWRVLKPGGVVFVNLGDKRATSGGHDDPGISSSSTLRGNGHVGGVGKAGPQKIKGIPRAAHEFDRQGLRGRLAGTPPDRASRATGGTVPDQGRFGRAKSKMLLPHRYAQGCEDGLADPCAKNHEHVGRHPAYTEAEQCRGVGWIVRQDIVWSKPNGLPESVTDRPRDSHEVWFMLTKAGRYFSAADEIREAYAPGTAARYAAGYNITNGEAETAKGYSNADGGPASQNPLGKLPGSVWSVPSEPLRTPEYMVLGCGGSMKPQWIVTEADAWRWMRWSGVDRSPWPRPDHGEPGPFLCAAPGHFAAFPSEWPRRLILGWSPSGVCVDCGEGRRPVVDKKRLDIRPGYSKTHNGATSDVPQSGGTGWKSAGVTEATISGYTCGCPSPTAPTTPALVLDPFAGTGTTPMVARALGRYGLGIDLSADYLRLARWRTFESGHAAKAVARTNREAQGSLLG